MDENLSENTDKNNNQELRRASPQNEGTGARKVRNKTLGGLVIFSVAIFGFSVWFIGHQLREPFAITRNGSANTKDQTNVSTIIDTNNIALLDDLRFQDTDQDGLSDYDELYVFKTSPYLSDSDSDKINDSLEVDQGTDPNCPEGADCGRAVAADVTTNTNSFLSDIRPETNVNQTPIDVNNLSADDLRNILRDAGVSEISLGELDDEQLVATYRDVITAEGNGDLNTNTVTAVSNTTTGSNQAAIDETLRITYERLKDLTPEEIRQLLIENGVDQEQLNSIDDETLQQIYLESLQQNIEGATRK